MADKAVSPESNDMGSNLKCVPLSELFTLSELQEMEDKNPRSTWRKKNAHCKHHGVIEDAKYDGAHKARDAVSTWSVRNVYGLPSFLPVREAGGSSGEADSVSEASPWPGPHSWEERRAPRERAEGTHLPEKRVGGGGREQHPKSLGDLKVLWELCRQSRSMPRGQGAGERGWPLLVRSENQDRPLIDWLLH